MATGSGLSGELVMITLSALDRPMSRRVRMGKTAMAARADNRHLLRRLETKDCTERTAYFGIRHFKSC